jgi:Glycosyl transferase family 11
MIVVAQSIGQVGNRLIQFSHLIAFSRDHNVPIANPAFSLYAEFFEHTQHSLFCSYPSSSRAWVGKPLQRFLYYVIRVASAGRILKLLPRSIWVEQHWTGGEYDLSNPQFVEFARTKDFVFLTGSWMHRYRRNPQAHLNTVREYFQLRQDLRDKIAQYFMQVRQAADIVVGTHIRQGDNASDPVRRDAFSTAQYALVMQRTAALFPGKKVVFVVCSDRTQSQSAFAGLTIFRGPGSFIEDMYVLAECDYIMGAGQSSFSLWASLMGQKPRYALLDPEKEINLSDFQVCREI